MVVHNPLKVAGAGSIPAVVTKGCVVCSTEFIDRSPNKSAKYCGTSCRSKVYNKKTTIYRVRGTKICPGCGIEFDYTSKTYRQKFCTRSCSATFHNKKNKKRSYGGSCDTCRSPCPASRKFCSAECRLPKMQGWLSGADWSYVDGTLPAPARNYLLAQAGYQCPCGWDTPNPKTGKVILTINHIDGNWRNNKIENLEVLCYNCHTLTDTFGSLNAGSVSGRRPNAGRSN